MFKNRKGFLWIELIVALVVLAFLSVALMRYLGLHGEGLDGAGRVKEEVVQDLPAGRAAVPIADGREAADRVADSVAASACSTLSMAYAAYRLNKSGAPVGPAAACATLAPDGRTVQRITCTGDAWTSGSQSTITVIYAGGSSERKVRTWTVP